MCWTVQRNFGIVCIVQLECCFNLSNMMISFTENWQLSIRSGDIISMVTMVGFKWVVWCCLAMTSKVTSPCCGPEVPASAEKLNFRDKSVGTVYWNWSSIPANIVLMGKSTGNWCCLVWFKGQFQGLVVVLVSNNILRLGNSESIFLAKTHTLLIFTNRYAVTESSVRNCLT